MPVREKDPPDLAAGLPSNGQHRLSSAAQPRVDECEAVRFEDKEHVDEVRACQLLDIRGDRSDLHVDTLLIIIVNFLIRLAHVRRQRKATGLRGVERVEELDYAFAAVAARRP